ncbi:hypothetical protein FNV43_RR00467 [Rhamnella rubrinervis]|uniref:Uncharacterized protein n=1 Tax=Rhamnella rubrinervis TaxID=2594499 RepID=A0A8K0MSF6_9ROSA|nr:hypothetical protein FNV43_RR00467 [Rhamnella rubrinervis]
MTQPSTVSSSFHFTKNFPKCFVQGWSCRLGVASDQDFAPVLARDQFLLVTCHKKDDNNNQEDEEYDDDEFGSKKDGPSSNNPNDKGFGWIQRVEVGLYFCAPIGLLVSFGEYKCMMGSVEKTEGLVTGAQTSLLEEMKSLKEMQDQSGL